MKPAVLRSLNSYFLCSLGSLFHLGIFLKYFAHGLFFGWV